MVLEELLKQVKFLEEVVEEFEVYCFFVQEEVEQQVLIEQLVEQEVVELLGEYYFVVQEVVEIEVIEECCFVE